MSTPAPQHMRQTFGTNSGVPPTLSQPQDCPVLIWMLSLNREYTVDEYDALYSFLNDHFPRIKLGAYTPEDPNSFRHLITQLLPILMMRHQRVPKAKWRDCVAPNGKHWIEQLQDGLPPERFLHSMIGYSIQYGPSLCGIAMTQGMQKRVVNIGLGIQMIMLPSRFPSLHHYIDSLSQQLTPNEINLIPRDQGEETALRRLAILLALKEAYVHAVGQPHDFNYLRLDFNVPASSVHCDGHALEGWEFRLWNVKLGVARGDAIVEELYMCVSAFFRSTRESTFVWNDNRRNLSSWVQFVDIDQMIRVLPRLSL